MLKSQDVLIVLKLAAVGVGSSLTYADLAESIGLSVSEAHASLKRAERSGLLHAPSLPGRSPGDFRVSAAALREFLCYGVPYVWPAEERGVVDGVRTASSASPLVSRLAPSTTIPHVWKVPWGDARGIEITPIHPSAPGAARRDPTLAEWLALVDALRLFSGRVAGLAQEEIQHRLRGLPYAPAA
jgi:hypothetical protein